MKRLALGLIGGGVVLLGLLVAVGARGGQEEPFPHAEHMRLFPLCTGCHEGVPEGNLAEFYPEESLCARCHNGERLDSVEWRPPRADETEPFEFTHPGHQVAVASTGDEPLECAVCHVRQGDPRMAIERQLVLERCLSCHGHPADDHLVDAPCQVCHGPAAETEMGGAWLATLPYPADHVTGDFLRSGHGQLAAAEPGRCATCHTQERCTSCHVDAASVPEIARIPAARAGLEVPRYAAHYFEPPSHEAPGFLDGHGELASVEACSTCHTQNDCASCHTADQPAVVAALPRAEEVRAPGVLLEPSAPTSHRLASFIEEHGSQAAADPSSCTSCHVRTECSECHQAAAIAVVLPQDLAGPRFHPVNYMARHSAEAYGRRLECSNCHDTGAFCRDCHQEAGFRASGRLDPGFHDAEPNWLLRHGQPARQALESCASCHTQRDCLQCHSELGSFQISPHGRDFDARRAQEKNPAICFACHVSDPLAGPD